MPIDWDVADVRREFTSLKDCVEKAENYIGHDRWKTTRDIEHTLTWLECAQAAIEAVYSALEDIKLTVQEEEEQ